MKRIIIDTNAWMAITEFRLDIFAALERDCDFSYQIIVLPEIIAELEKIVSQQRAKFRQAALLAMGIMKVKKILVVSDKGESDPDTVDDLLVQHSKKGDLVLTQDAALKKRLKKPYLTIRQKKTILLVK